jgi:hypothetical protein
MSTTSKQDWITGEEYGRERARLIRAGVPDDAPEFRELEARVDARNEYLFETYGRPYMHTHHGQWIVLAEDGRSVVGSNRRKLLDDAIQAFGSAIAVVQRLDDKFPGLRFHV